MRKKPDTSTVPKDWTLKEQIEELYTLVNIIISDVEKIREILEHED